MDISDLDRSTRIHAFARVYRNPFGKAKGARHLRIYLRRV